MSQGIQDNKQQKVDLIYTKKGRFLKSMNSRKAEITKFALSDDGVDYNLYNENAVDGEKGLRILRTPQLEAFTSETGMMKNKLLSLERDVSETESLEISSDSLVFEVDPNSTGKVIPKAITIYANFRAPNGFKVTLANSEYVYVNHRPKYLLEYPDDNYPTIPVREDEFSSTNNPLITESVRSSGTRNGDNTRNGDREKRRTINTHFRGERPQELIVGRSNTKPSETVITVFYSDNYKKFTEDVPVKTKLVIESLDTADYKEVEIEVRKQV